ncbi:hypothetical protein HZA87_04285 [Candidatus Uhrbacteria bacterium]|nr:hypothetical protein [Candidatus Uhrbacteria bacterium]
MMKRNLMIWLSVLAGVFILGGVMFVVSRGQDDARNVQEGSVGRDVEIPTEKPASPVIYVTVFTHNEDGLGTKDPDYTKDEDEFWTDRKAVIEFAQMLKDHHVGYDFQSDWNFLLAIQAFDQGTDSSHGKNVLRYLSEDLDAQVDIHSHQSMGYNMADVGYLMIQLGVTPSGIVGGMIASPSEDSLLEDFWEPMEANKFDYTWTAEAIFGGGTSLHQDEESLWTSGVWRPQDNEHYLVNDDGAPIPSIGYYESNWDGLDDLLAHEKAGDLEAGKMYTIAINAHQRDFNEAFKDEFEARLETYDDETALGTLVWVTFDEVLDIWHTTYNEDPNIFKFDGDAAEASDSSQPGGTVGGGGCGNGVCEALERKRGVCAEDCS